MTPCLGVHVPWFQSGEWLTLIKEYKDGSSSDAGLKPLLPNVVNGQYHEHTVDAIEMPMFSIWQEETLRHLSG